MVILLSVVECTLCAMKTYMERGVDAAQSQTPSPTLP